MKRFFISTVFIVSCFLFYFPNFPLATIQQIELSDELILSFGPKVYYQLQVTDGDGKAITKFTARFVSVSDGVGEVPILEFPDGDQIWEDELLMSLRLSKEALKVKGLNPRSIQISFPEYLQAQLMRSSGGGPLLRVFNNLFRRDFIKDKNGNKVAI